MMAASHVRFMPPMSPSLGHTPRRIEGPSARLGRDYGASVLPLADPAAPVWRDRPRAERREIAQALRQRYGARGVSPNYSAIARAYGMHRVTAWYILHDRCYRDLTPTKPGRPKGTAWEWATKQEEDAIATALAAGHGYSAIARGLSACLGRPVGRGRVWAIARRLGLRPAMKGRGA